MARDLTETTLESRRGFDGKLLKVRVDTVQLPDGGRSTREIVEHRGSVVVIPVHNGSVYLVRQYRHATGETLLELPAGTIDEGEDKRDTARRETEEEVGLTPARLTWMLEGYVSPGYSSEVQSYWLAEGLTPADAESDEDEFMEVVSMPLREALEWALSGECRDAKTVVGLLLAARRLDLC